MTALRIKHEGLPADERPATSTDAEPGDAPWSKTEMLICDLIDAVNENTYVLLTANADKPADVPKPEPVPRPGVKRTKDTGRIKPDYKPADPLLLEWLTRRQNGEDTSDLDAMFHNVRPMRPMTKPTGGDDGDRGRSQP